jgi:hypothetical protein
MRAALESRLAALEARLIEPTEPRKSLLPPWLMEELEKQGVGLDAYLRAALGQLDSPDRQRLAAPRGITGEQIRRRIADDYEIRTLARRAIALVLKSRQASADYSGGSAENSDLREKAIGKR